MIIELKHGRYQWLCSDSASLGKPVVDVGNLANDLSLSYISETAVFRRKSFLRDSKLTGCSRPYPPRPNSAPYLPGVQGKEHPRKSGLKLKIL